MSPVLESGALRRLRRTDLPAATLELARYLLGKIVVHDLGGATLAGRIVETEAYMPHDRASHAFRGETARNRAMFLARGTAYVYLSYGMHFCFNVASERRGVGAAVLLRALEPISGIEAMRRNRAGVRDLDLARGPGRLSAALGITAEFDGYDLCGAGGLWLAEDGKEPERTLAGPRIGITKDADRPWRFWVAGSRYVSAKRSV